MTYQDQRNDDHPEAVRSDPVPVQRTAPDDDLDRDRDGVDDRTEADRGFHDSTAPEGGYHDSTAPEGGYHDSTTPEAGYHDNVTGQDDDTVDADRDGVDDRVEDGEVRDDTDVYHEAEAEPPADGAPAVTAAVDTDVDRAGVDRADLDEDRAEDDRDLPAPTFPDSAMAP